MRNLCAYTLRISAALLLPAIAVAGAPGPDSQSPVSSPAIPLDTSIASDATTASETPATPMETIARALVTPPLDLRPTDFTVNYKLRYAAFSADLTLSLRKQPPTADSDTDRFMATAKTRARGLAKLFVRGKPYEQANFSFAGNRLLPGDYVLESGKKAGEDSGEISFDWEQMTADSLYEGAPKELALDTDVYDRISADIVVITDLLNGRQPRELRIAEKNQLRDYTFTYEDDERIKTAAGEFDTVRYLRQRTGSSRSTRIWYARDLGYLPVRMEQLKNGKTAVTSDAQSIEWAGKG